MIRKSLAAITGLLALSLSAAWMAGSSLSSPANATVIVPHVSYKLESIEVKGVHGWYIPSTAHKACVLLMHGVRSNRKEMLGRAEFLREEGFSSFAIDLYAHGETAGEHITYGYKESNSARIAVDYLYKDKNCEKVVALGNSLGGAASLLGERPIAVDGYILEAVYPSIEKAVANRLAMRFGQAGRLLAPILYMQIPMRLGVELEKLQPIEAIRSINAPVLVINGSHDQRTTLAKAYTKAHRHLKSFMNSTGLLTQTCTITIRSSIKRLF